MAQDQALAHLLAAQVEVAIFQAHVLAHLVVELERQRLGAVQRRELARQDLDLARGEVGVGGAGGTRAHQAAHAHDVFAAQALGFGEELGIVRIEHDLDQTLAVAQVDEDHPAVIAATIHPPGNGDFAAG